MRQLAQFVLLSAVFTVPAPALFAQTAIDPSGHWVGTVQIPGREVTVEIDLRRTDRGVFSGTLNTPAENIRGVPLQTVAIDGTSIRFHSRRDQPFAATLSTDGKAMFGEYTISGYSLPFSMNRTGDAEVIDVPPSPAIAKRLEGTWNGTLAVGQRALRLTLTLSNRADGTAMGRMVSLDEGGLELPVTIAQDAVTVTITAGITGSEFSGVLNADGTELAGTLTQRGFSAPLTFRAARD